MTHEHALRSFAEQATLKDINADYKERFGFHDAENYLYKAPKGLTRDTVLHLSKYKNEPEWMLEFRLKALDHFLSRPQPTWGSPMLAEVDYDNIHYFVRASEKASKTWDDVPEDIKNTFDRLGHPRGRAQVPLRRRRAVRVRGRLPPGARGPREAGRHLHGHGLGAARARGPRARVLRDDHPVQRQQAGRAQQRRVVRRLVRLRAAKGVHVEMPLQAYFRINTENMGQFERTLIIADEGSYVHYVEGCTAPVWSTDSLHSAVVELIAKPGARIRYTTVQNWSQNVFNLVTKRAVAQTDATVEWVDCNLGSKLTMKYPSVYLMGERAHGEVLSIAFAGNGQHQDAGAKIVHAAPNTTSNIFAKSISKDGGRSSYRGLLEVAKGAHGSKSTVVCDALLLDEDSRSDTYPTIRISEDDVQVAHEATVSKVGDEQVFYLQSHGIPEDEAAKMIVNGFIEPIVKELPMEYAVEMNRLIELQMEGSIG